jgi:hypothetical protein
MHMDCGYLNLRESQKTLNIGSVIVRAVWSLRCSKVVIVIMLLLSITVIIPPQAEAASEAIGVNLIVNNFLNDSQAKALAWLVFDGAKPSQNNVDNLIFEWYDPDGQLAFTDVIDPDKEAVAWSYYNLTKTGEWSVNVSYEGNTSMWNHKVFDAVPNYWGPGAYYVTRTTLVSFNSTLTIVPGTTVYFDENKGLGVEGKLVARGTELQPITFTSNLSTQSAGDWSLIQFYESADNASVIDYVKVEYSREGLNIVGCSPFVANSTFINNKERAMSFTSSNSYVLNNVIEKGGETIHPWGIFSARSNLTLEGNVIRDMDNGFYFINSDNITSVRIVMFDNLVENSEFNGLFARNSFILSENDRFIDNRKGVYLDTECNATFENLEITGGKEGFTAKDNVNATLWNSTIQDVEVATFVLNDNSMVTLINCVFSTNDGAQGVSIGASDTSILVIRNFLDIKTISYDNGSNLENAVVMIYDGTNRVYTLNTGSNGRTPTIIVTDKIYRPTLVENLTRVYVYLGNLYFKDNNRSVDMSESHMETFLGSVNPFNETDTNPPYVWGHSPVEAQVPLNILITITFNEAMQEDTVEGNFSASPGITGSFQWVGNTLVFIPTNLVNNTYYTITMATGAKDLAGNFLEVPYQFSFLTLDITDTTPPIISGIYPTGTDVPTDFTFINITFNEEMQHFSTEGAFSIEPRIPGIFSWSGSKLQFRPIFELDELTDYTITMDSSQARDTVGNLLDGNANGVAEGSPVDDYSWQFTTRRNDFTPPFITRVYPTGNMVDRDTLIKIYFSEAMNKTSVENAFSFTNGTVTWTSLDGVWGRSVYILRFTPTEPFNYFQVITVTLLGTAADALGNTLDGNNNGTADGTPADDYTWTFKTIYDPTIGLPNANETSPQGANVGSDDEIYINFSQKMDHNSVEGAFTITDGMTIWDADDGAFVWIENKTIFTPGFILSPDTVYTIRINNTATNPIGYPLDGNGNGIPENYSLDAFSWNFRTDLPEPVITQVSVDGQDIFNQSERVYVDSGGLIQIGFNIVNIANFYTGYGFNVTLINQSGAGSPLVLNMPSLDPGQDSGTYYFSWPAPVTIGDHMVDIVVDEDNFIIERNENNNTFALILSVGPDYISGNISVNGMDASDPLDSWYVNFGEPVNIGVDVKNTGFSGVSPTILYSIAFWNTTAAGVFLDPSAFHMATGLSGLGQGASSGFQYAPWDVPNQAGDFYVAIIVDYDDTTVEIDEGNNMFLMHLIFECDYTLDNIMVDGSDAGNPDIAWAQTAGDIVAISVNATNLGFSGVHDSVSYEIAFFNSTESGNSLGPAFFTTSLPGLSSLEDSGAIIGTWIAPNFAGEHYVLVSVDPDNLLSETNEQNNEFVLHFTIGPDIRPTAVTVNSAPISRSPSTPIYVGPGEVVGIEVNATNFGYSGTGIDFNVVLYNGTWNAGMLDSPYMNITVPALDASGSPGSDSGIIPGSWVASHQAGLHYVVIYMDISQVCGELNENNNYWVLTFVVDPDLVPSNISVDGLPISSYPGEIVELLPGQSIVIGATTLNIGQSSTGIMQFAVAFFNSTEDGVYLGPSFVYWGSLGPLGSAGSTADLFASWTAPYPNQPTDYYINISVDSDGAISETDEGNNYYIIHVSVDAPDLIPDRVVVESVGGDLYYITENPQAIGFISEEIFLPVGVDLIFTFDVLNFGGVDLTVGTNVSFFNTSSLGGQQNATAFYETSPTWVLLGGKSSPSWDQTSEVGQTMVVMWVNPGAYGLWYINITINSGASIPEFNSTDNTFILIINITDIPVTNLNAATPSYASSALYVNSSAELNFTVSGENPPFYTFYRIIDMDSAIIVKNWANYTAEGANFSMLWGEGTYKIEYYSTDSINKTEKTKTRIVIVDDSAPETNLNIGNPWFRDMPADFVNVTSSTPLHFIAQDYPLGQSIAGAGMWNGSGINTIMYRIQNVSSWVYVRAWTVITEGVPFLMDGAAWGDGYYRIWFYSWDNLQQLETEKYVTVYLDDNGPVTSMDIGAPNWTTGAGGRINITSGTPLTILSYESEGSMPNASTIMHRITYTDQGVNSGWRYGFAFDIGGEFYQGDGNYTIEFVSQDHLGNMLNVGMIHLYVDDTVPSLNLTIGVPRFRIYSSDAYNITGATPINLTVDDDMGSGISKIEYRIYNAAYDSGWMNYTSDFNLTGLAEGFYTIQCRVIDHVDNSQTQNLEIYLDVNAPVTLLSLGEPQHKAAPSHIWNITSATQLSLVVVYENGSGLAVTEYRISNASYDSLWRSYTIGFYLNSTFSDDEYTIRYRSMDKIGNMEIEHVILVRLDNTPPSAQISPGGMVFWDSLDGLWYIGSSNTFNKTAQDGSGSGVAAIWHRIYNNDTGFYYSGWLSEVTFSLNMAPGNYTIEYYAADNVTNANEVGYLYLYFDSVAPSSSIDIGVPKYLFELLDGWTVTQNTLFTMNGDDGIGSGLENIYYSIWDPSDTLVVSANPYTVPFNLSGLGQDGRYTIRFWASDNVGNTEVWDTIFVIVDSTPPQVVSVLPTGSGNSVRSYIQVIFSEEVDRDSVAGAFSYSDGTDTWDLSHGTAHWFNNILTFQPYENLSYNTLYTVTIASTTTDPVGNGLDGDGDGVFEGAVDIYSWFFTIREKPDSTPPYIVSSNPLHDSIFIDINSAIEIVFSETMDELSVEDAFSYTDGTNIFTSDDCIFTWTGNTTVITPVAPFEFSSSYIVTISQLAADFAGNPLSGTFFLNFTTTNDDVPPYIQSYTPSDENVSVGTQITISFNEIMDKQSVEEALLVVPEITGSLSWDSNTLILTPDGPLAYGTIYYVQVDMGAADAYGNTLETTFLFDFTTEPDVFPPSILGHSPSGTEVALTENITITFNEAMDSSSVESAFEIAPYVSGTFSWDANTVTFSSTELKSATTYSVTLGINAQDIAGNALQSPYQFSFTTVIDPFPPFIIEVEPTGTNVSVSAEIRITFSEPMDNTSLYGAFNISPYVPGALSWDGNTLIFTPNGKLDLDTTYNVTIYGSALDRGGNAMGVDHSWEFTTELTEVTEEDQYPWEIVWVFIFLIIFIIFILLLTREMRSHWLKKKEEPGEEPKDDSEDETEPEPEEEPQEEPESEPEDKETEL